MAVTITPQSIGQQGLTLNRISGDDPTYVEAPDPPVVIILWGSNVSFKVTAQAQDYPEYFARGSLGTISESVSSFSDAFHLVVQPKISDAILDQTVDPPVVEFTGTDLTNISFMAFTLDIPL